MFIFCNIITAFATFSRIPMPRIDYNEKNMKYSLCFFPLVGAVIGALVYLVFYLCGLIGISPFLRAALMLAVPVLLTGGIHLDGYCDTVDALSSFAPRERKLEILKDSNSGAFAIIYCVLWFALYGASLAEIGAAVAVLPFGFVMSRAMSALAVVNFKAARQDGMGAHEKQSASHLAVNIAMPIYIVLSAMAMILIHPVCGIVGTAAAALSFVYYRVRSYRQFGGFTGDLAGWFLQICELMICLSVTLAEKIAERIGALL